MDHLQIQVFLELKSSYFCRSWGMWLNLVREAEYGPPGKQGLENDTRVPRTLVLMPVS